MRHFAWKPLSLALGSVLAGIGAGPVAAQERAVARMPDDPAIEWGGCPGFMPEGCQTGVLHGDPAKPDADIFFRVPGGAEMARHWHNSPERMVLVTGEMRVSYDGQEPVTLEPRSYAYGPVRKPHSGTCLSAEPCTLFIAFTGPIDAMEGAPD